MFPIPAELEEHLAYVTHTEEHDLGIMREAAIKYDRANSRAVDFAFRVESKMPEYWDEEAKAELGIQTETITPQVEVGDGVGEIGAGDGGAGVAG